MDERDAEAVLLLANSLDQVGKYREAATLLYGLIAANVTDGRVARLLVKVLLASGRYAEAEPIAKQQVEAASGRDLPAALFFHAHSLWGCGDREGCRAAVERYSAALAAERR